MPEFRSETGRRISESAHRNLTSNERSMRASKAANTRWSRTSSADASEQARRRILDRFDRLVDPEGTMDPGERVRRADQARRAHFTGLALKAAKARRLRAQAAALQAEVDAEVDGVAVMPLDTEELAA